MNVKGAILRILKDYGAYHSYTCNFRKLERYGAVYGKSEESFDNFFEKFSRHRGSKNKAENITNLFYYFINDSFLWDKTGEGRDYWDKMLQVMNYIGHSISGMELDSYFSKYPVDKEYIETIKKILYGKGKKII